MNIRVIYHSSTGNTKKLAEAMAEELGIEAESLNGGAVSVTDPVDLLFVGDGIYAGRASSKMRAFIETLDPQTVKNVGVFATYGGQTKIGADMIALLRKKDLNVVGEAFVCKGRAWWLMNRNHPDQTDLSQVRVYAKRIASQVDG